MGSRRVFFCSHGYVVIRQRRAATLPPFAQMRGVETHDPRSGAVQRKSLCCDSPIPCYDAPSLWRSVQQGGRMRLRWALLLDLILTSGTPSYVGSSTLPRREFVFLSPTWVQRFVRGVKQTRCLNPAERSGRGRST